MENVNQETVRRAREGDQDAVTNLYNLAYMPVLFTIRSIIRDEDEAMDILQDTFLRAFGHLDQLKDDSRFLPWIKQIAVNTAKNGLKKKKPMLFSQLAGEDSTEDDRPIEESLPGESAEGLPEEEMDREETARLLREILDGLPEEQRAAVCMFYYDQMSVREIAAFFGITENLVKVRLNRGRKKVEEGVLDLEKRGTKLYGLAPIPFLLFLFRQMDVHAAGIQPEASILQSVLRKTTSGKGTASQPTKSGGGEPRMPGKKGYGAGKAALRTASSVPAVKAAAIIVSIALVSAAAVSIRNRTDSHTTDILPTEAEEETEVSLSGKVDEYNMAMYLYKQILSSAIEGKDLTYNGFDRGTVGRNSFYIYNTSFAVAELTGSSSGIPQLLIKEYYNENLYRYLLCVYFDGQVELLFQVKGYDPDTNEYLGGSNPSCVIGIEDGEFVPLYTLHGRSVSKKYYSTKDMDGNETEITKEEYSAIIARFSAEDIPVTWLPLDDENIESCFGNISLSAYERQYLDSVSE